MLLLVVMIVVTLFAFVVMWKSSATAINIKSTEYDDAYGKAKTLALISAIMLAISLVVIAGLLYLKFSPTGRVSRTADGLLAKMF